MFMAMIKKEFLLVFRDKHALLALFIMPAIFVLIMSVALKEQFNQEIITFDISISDLSKSELSKKFVENLKEDKTINILNNNADADLKITIPKNYFSENKKLFIVLQDSIRSDLLELFKSKLSKKITTIKLSLISNFLPVNSLDFLNENLFDIEYFKSEKIPSSTQQSVPSWILFGMFFIIIPMSTIYINEKKQNTLVRLNSMNVSLFSMTVSKIIPYLVINQFQVWIMIGVGIFVVPFFGAPALEINGSIFAIIFLSIAISISAVGLSNLIAVSATSSEQATTIGGILNILLGAIGGVMVPKFIMPESMHVISNLSPMSWGLDGFLKIFLESGNIVSILPESSILTLFGVVSLVISMIILQLRIKKGL